MPYSIPRIQADLDQHFQEWPPAGLLTRDALLARFSGDAARRFESAAGEANTAPTVPEAVTGAMHNLFLAHRISEDDINAAGLGVTPVVSVRHLLPKNELRIEPRIQSSGHASPSDGRRPPRMGVLAVLQAVDDGGEASMLPMSAIKHQLATGTVSPALISEPGATGSEIKNPYYIKYSAGTALFDPLEKAKYIGKHQQVDESRAPVTSYYITPKGSQRLDELKAEYRTKESTQRPGTPVSREARVP